MAGAWQASRAALALAFGALLKNRVELVNSFKYAFIPLKQTCVFVRNIYWVNWKMSYTLKEDDVRPSETWQNRSSVLLLVIITLTDVTKNSEACF